MLRRAFRAMGTDVELLLDAEPDDRAERALERAEAEFERLEQILSRFREGSELSALNRDGRTDAATPDLARVVALAIEARAATGGLFDPTLHDALVAAGYDRDFAALEVAAPATAAASQLCVDSTQAPGETADLSARGTPGLCVDSTRSPSGGGVLVDGATIELGPGTRLDLGGIGKGYAADRVADALAAAGPCLVNAGGDLAVRGGSWPIGVTDAVTLELTCGGMATSGRDRRRWSTDGEEHHHLIDPATGRSAVGAPLRVTVVAESATAAEIAAKVVFLGGHVDLPCVVVTADGVTVLAGGLA